MIDAKYMSEYELQRVWESHVRKTHLIDLPGVGVVGSSDPKVMCTRCGSVIHPTDACGQIYPTTPTIPATTTEWNGVVDLREACKHGEHPACSGYSAHGELCECACRVDQR